MAIHLQVSTKTRGGAVDPRKGPGIRKSIFPRGPTLAAFRRMTTGGLCAIALLILVQPDRSQQTDAGIRAAAMLRRPASASEVGWHKHLNGQAKGVDPAQALARTFALEKGGERESHIRNLLCAWAAQDAEEALGWVSSLEDPAARGSARATVCLAVAENDPRRSVMLALAHGTDQDDDCGLLECLTMQWCEKESEAVLTWASEQPPGEWRERLLARASFVLSKSDPAAAAHLVSGLEPGPVQVEAAMAVLHQWALKDSSAALQWAEAFSEPTLRERALAEISNLRDLTTSIQDVR